MTFIEILTLIGSIGLFLYGMKLVSEGLQKIAGDSFHDVLASMTGNRVTGMLTGFLMTTLVQSSSATTVMIVSFANAGLISLAESLAVIMGINLGATTTTWFISLLSFRLDFAAFIFPIIALSLPLFQSGHSRRNSWGEFIVGLALILLSVESLKHCIPSVTNFPSASDWVDLLNQGGILTNIVMLVVGILITMCLQASSITVILSMLLCAGGWLTLEASCAMIVGANIGTCITPLIASRHAHVVARQAALCHLVFNISGAIWIMLFFGFVIHSLLLPVSSWLGFGDVLNLYHASYGIQVSLCLALFHTLFNLLNLCILLPLTRQFSHLISRFIPESQDEDKSFKLQYISSGLISSAELALVQVRQETSRYGEETYKMFKLVNEMLHEPLGSERQLLLNDQIRQMEEQSDAAEIGIADFLNQISPKSISLQGEQMCRNLYKIVDELESIADSIYHISATLYAKSEQRVFFSQELNENVDKMFVYIDQALVHMNKVLTLDEVPSNVLNKAYNIEDEINNLRNQFRNTVLDQFDRQEVQYQQSTFFMMIINECEKIGDYVINVIAANSDK